jgi:hypothetical protein
MISLKRGLPNTNTLNTYQYEYFRQCTNTVLVQIPSDTFMEKNAFYYEADGLNFAKLIYLPPMIHPKECIAHWGSASNVYDMVCSDVKEGLLFEFKTLHSPPFRYFRELSKKFPQYRFYIQSKDVTYGLHFQNVGYHNGIQYDM